MPSFKVDVPHDLPQEDAKNRVTSLMENMRTKFEGQIKDMEQTWNEYDMNFSFRTLGTTIKGVMQILPGSVLVQGDLPFTAMLFKGRIEKDIRGELERCLGKS